MKIIYANSGADLKEIKDFGYDVIIGDFTPYELYIMKTLDLKNIASKFTIENESIIGYYLYDEPDLHNISIEDQDKKIAAFRELTDKPLCVAMIEEIEQKCSSNYDWYLIDIYYSTNMSKIKNYVNIAISSHFAKVLYKGKKIIPIIGLYDDKGAFKYTDEIFNFNDKFRSYFRTNDLAVYLWKGDGANYFGVDDRTIYRRWARYFNNTEKKCWWITSKILYAVAWSTIKINPIFGKYRITIP